MNMDRSVSSVVHTKREADTDGCTGKKRHRHGKGEGVFVQVKPRTTMCHLLTHTHTGVQSWALFAILVSSARDLV